MDKNFFITWTRQSGAATLDVAGAREDEFILADGRRIFDLVSTSFQTSFGHSNAKIVDRIQAQLLKMPIASPKAVFDLKEDVTDRLLQLLRVDGGKVLYTVSGAESVENALKIARQFTGRKIVLARRRSYHGASLGAMSVSGDWRSRDHVNFTDGTVRIPEPYDDPEAQEAGRIVEQTGSENIAALIVEPISGVNGVIIPPQSWWRNIEQLCRRQKILLICDEVLNGFGRTGKDFGFHHFGVTPDLVTMSKAISGGYVPFGAVWTSSAIAKFYDQTTLACGLTNYAHPLGLAALEAVLDLVVDPAFIDQRRNLEKILAEWSDRIRSFDNVVDVRCQGMLAAIDLNRPAPTWQAMIDVGVYGISKENSLILAPPLVANASRLEAALAALESLIATPVATRA